MAAGSALSVQLVEIKEECSLKLPRLGPLARHSAVRCLAAGTSPSRSSWLVKPGNLALPLALEAHASGWTVSCQAVEELQHARYRHVIACS